MSMWPGSLLAPMSFTQPILPDWLSTNVTINNYKGVPDVETEVIRDVASFGRQIGWLTEIVLALAEGKHDLPAETVEKLNEAAKKIEEIKARRATSTRTDAVEALERLQKEYPDRYRRLVLDKAADLKTSNKDGSST